MRSKMMSEILPSVQVKRGPYTSVGFWMAALIGLAQLLSAIKAATDPLAFATQLGLPPADPSDIGFVHIYALRTSFVALLILGLLVTKNMKALTWAASAAIVMPLGDAYLTYQAGAPSATVGKHIGYVVYVSVMAGFFWHWILRQGQDS
jgi:hypothetical protein